MKRFFDRLADGDGNAWLVFALGTAATFLVIPPLLDWWLRSSHPAF